MYLRKVKGGWRAEVERQGVRTSATRASKADAQAWGMREEAAILAGARGEYPDRTLAEAIERYRREVTDKKRNQRPIVASVTDSPRVGTRISVIVCFPFAARRPRAGASP